MSVTASCRRLLGLVRDYFAGEPVAFDARAARPRVVHAVPDARSWMPPARCRVARRSRTASSRRSPGGRTPPARRAPSARTTASASWFPVTASSRQAASAPTGRSAANTSDGCSSWRVRVSLSEDLRNELAAITPHKDCDRPCGAVRPRAHRRHDPPARRTPRRRAFRPGQLGGRPPRLQPVAPLRDRQRDPHVHAARIREGDALPAPRARSRSRASGPVRGGDSVGAARPARAAAARGGRS